MLMVRPHVLTCALGPVLAVLLLEGAPWQVALVAAGANWVHLNFFWMTPLILAVLVAVGWCVRRPVRWGNVVGAFVGWLAGWALRPNPLGAAKLLYVQIFELSRVKQAGVPLTFGDELLPMEPKAFAMNFLPFLLAWLAAAAILLWVTARVRERISPETKLRLWGTLLLSGVFFEMTFVMSRRAADLWVAFAVPFLALAWTAFLEPWRGGAAGASGGREWPGSGRLAGAGCLQLVLEWARGSRRRRSHRAVAQGERVATRARRPRRHRLPSELGRLPLSLLLESRAALPRGHGSDLSVCL